MNKPIHPTAKVLIKLRRHIVLTCLGLILFVWSILYLPNLRTSPPWYGDEIFSLDIGKSLTHGELVNRALYCTFFSYDANYQPAFTFLVGIASRLTDGDILGGRFFSVLIGLATATTGFWFLHRRYGFFCGLSCALLLLGYAQSIIHYRWIYPHNMVGLGLLGAVGLLMRPARLSNDWKAGVFLTLGAGSHFLGISAAAFMGFFRYKHPKSLLVVLLPPILLLIFTFGWVSWIYKDWPTKDFINLLGIYNRHSIQNGSGFKVLVNFYNFFLQDYYHLISFFAILFCLRRRSYTLSLSALGLCLLLLRNRQNLSVFYYQAMIVLPILSATNATGFYRIISLISNKFRLGKLSLRYARAGLFISCLFFCLANVPNVIFGHLPVRIIPYVVKDIPSYDATAKWINERTSPDDLVVAHWNFSWLLHCRNPDILMCTAWVGLPGGDVFDPPPPHERFRYPSGIEYAKYFVINEQDEIWTFYQPYVSTVLQDFKVFTWPLVFQSGSMKVLKNPNPAKP